MDSGKIILFNLSDGALGVQSSQLLGQIIISKIQLATMSRQDTDDRPPFYLYLDEFQTFTGTSETAYSVILSRSRKYNMGLILAHQQTGQIPDKLLRDILGNVTTFIAFNVSNDDATRLSREYTYSIGQSVDHVLPEEFLRLQTGEAIGKIGRIVFPLRTILMPQKPNMARVEYIINRSQQNYRNGEMPNTDAKRPRPPIQLPPPKRDEEQENPDEVFK
jgi:hypothetical protein